MNQSFLRTKTRIPPRQVRSVRRPRLINELMMGLERKLILVSAPPGYGKTTLLGEWIAALEQQPVHGKKWNIGWLSLDEDDRDPVRFWKYVIMALQETSPELGKESQELLSDPMSGASLRLAALPALLNELDLDAKPHLLILDDYHLANTEFVDGTLELFLDKMPANIHLVITSRSDPLLPLSKYRARDQLLEIRAEDLRFTREEATAFLNNIMNLKLDSEEVAALEQRTEGWAAGLQLAALSIQGRQDREAFITAFTGSHRYVMSYLVEEVLDRQPDTIRSFLLQTCLLDRFCAPLCEKLLATSSGQSQAEQVNTVQDMLEHLERINLFLVPLDDERYWFRYHHLFADVLRRKSKTALPKSQVNLFYQRASEWFEEEGFIHEAVHYALESSDGQHAFSLIERYGDYMIGQSEVSTLLHWYIRVPVEETYSRPKLAFLFGWALVLAQRLEEAEQLLEKVLQRLPPDVTEEIHGEVSALRAYLAYFRGDIHQSLQFSKQALLQIPEDQHGIRSAVALILGGVSLHEHDFVTAESALESVITLSEQGGNNYVKVVAISNLGFMKLNQGKLSESYRFFEQGIHFVEQENRPVQAIGSCYIGRGIIEYEQNQVEQAIETLRTGIKQLQRVFDFQALAIGYATLAKCFQTQANSQEALQTLEEGGSWLQKNEGDRRESSRQVIAEKAMLWLRQGKLELAHHWLEHVRKDSVPPNLFEQIAKVRVLLALANPSKQLDPRSGELLAEAGRFLDQLASQTETLGWSGGLIEYSIFRALYYSAIHNRQAAIQHLSGALELAAPEGFLRMFTDEGEPMGELLETAIESGMEPKLQEYARVLLGHIQSEQHVQTDEKQAVAPASHLPLSEREVEVLRLLAAGYSNTEIADRLFLSRGTVKRHLFNIYQKLGVHSRTQALSKAKELGLWN